MDRDHLQRELARAEAHIREGECHVRHQAEVVRHLEADGHNSALARQLLATFVEMQETHVADRDLIAKEIETAENMIRRLIAPSPNLGTTLKK
jgi:hypothetical protein